MAPISEVCGVHRLFGPEVRSVRLSISEKAETVATSTKPGTIIRAPRSPNASSRKAENRWADQQGDVTAYSDEFHTIGSIWAAIACGRQRNGEAKSRPKAPHDDCCTCQNDAVPPDNQG